VISKTHHAMTDGIGGLSILQALVDRTPDGRKGKRVPKAAPRPAAGSRSGPMEQLSNAFFHRAADETGRGLRTAAALGKGWGAMMLDPLGTSQRLQETASSLVRTLRPISEPLSPLMDRRSMTMRLEVMEFELDALKKAARKLEVTLNDIFVTAVTGGLRLYHEQMGETVDELRMSMPINVRNGDKGQRAGNQFAAARVQVPISIEDPLDRLRETHDRLHREKNEPAVSWIEEITTTINRLGPAAATRVVGSMFKAVDFVTSNVPGMPFEVYFAGSRIEALYPFGPPTGAALNVTLLSYDGRAFLGVNCDRAAVSDPDLLLECLGEGFAELLGR
jgi:diacylglycerol O-acyltransferase